MPSRARAASWLLLFSLAGGEPSPPASTVQHCHCRVDHCLRLAGARASVLLFEAASEGDVAKLQTLLEKDKYDVNWRGEYGMSPVHVATLNNHAECVRLLIRAGAKVNQFDNDGWTPLMAAAAFAEHKMVKMLLDAVSLTLFGSRTSRLPAHVCCSLVRASHWTGGEPDAPRSKGAPQGHEREGPGKGCPRTEGLDGYQVPRAVGRCAMQMLIQIPMHCYHLAAERPSDGHATFPLPCRVTFSTCRLLMAEGVKTWWAKKEAKERRREGRAAGADADAEEGLGDAASDDSADTKSEL